MFQKFGLVFGNRVIFFGLFQPLINRGVNFEATGVVLNMRLILKLNRLIKLSLATSVIYMVQSNVACFALEKFEYT